MREYWQRTPSAAGPGARTSERTPGKQTLTEKAYGGPVPGTSAKATSARFEGDTQLDKVGAGSATVKQGDRGLVVTKVQQALIDLGYLLPTYGVDATFEGETKAAVIKFQQDHPPLGQTGEVDKDTLAKLDQVYDTRKPYIDAAKVDPADPTKGTRTLSATDKKARCSTRSCLPIRRRCAPTQPRTSTPGR